MKLKYHILISSIAIVCLFGLANAKKAEVTASILWGERLLSWEDFPLIKSIPGDFHARVYSDIQFKGNRDDNSLRIYARMLPFRSGRVDLSEDMQLLIHEQNHFNITEYYARLFRQEVLKIDGEKLTNTMLLQLRKKYMEKENQMQSIYDFESEHNLIWDRQKYWELHIAGLLRETAYYADENLYDYQDFLGEKTEWYRAVQLNLEGQLITSYPENNKNSRLGDIYRVIRKQDSISVSFYNNGVPKVGGYFEAPISIITSPNTKTREVHLFDKNMTYFSSKTSVPISRTISDAEGNITRTYYDGESKPISKQGVFTQKGKWNLEKNSLYYSFYDKNKTLVKFDGAYHELREMNEQKLNQRISYFDKSGRPMRDKNFVSIYEYDYNDHNILTRVKRFDVDGKPTFFKDNYHMEYEHDIRGNIVFARYLDENGNNAADENGIHKYSFSYDLYGNITDVRKFNLRDFAANGFDDYHHSVSLFDSIGRMTFIADYYPDYVLKFSDSRDGAKIYEYVEDSLLYVRNLDAYGKEIENDFGISLRKQSLNDKSEVIKEEYLNEQGNWAKTEDGVTSYTYKYDERGNEIEIAAFDSLGKPRAYEKDVAITRWEYDARNNKIKTTYFTTDNTLANANQGVTYNIYKYDVNGNFLERTNYDRHMNPMEFDGVFRASYIVNRFGKDSISTIYDTNNNIKKGPSIMKSLYNDNGILVAEIFYDQNSRPTLNEMGIHKRILNHDKYGRYTGYSYQGKLNESINNLEGNSSMFLKLNTSGYVQKMSYFDKHEKPVLGPESYHSVEYHYNDMDAIVRSTTYGFDDNLMNNEEGIADFVFNLNNSGQINKISFYDADANLTEDFEGIAEYIYTPKLNGLFYLEKQLNAKGKEVVVKEEAEHEEELI